jgi:RimJ/RimL family protein N-acetyltransferase
MQSKNIKLTFFNEKFRNDLGIFRLQESQEKFTATPISALNTLKDRDRHFIVILADDRPVGYFILHENSGPIEIGSHEKALLIRSLAINESEQRKGYALAAMRILPDFVRIHFKNITELILLVNHANIAAQNLYIKAGFRDKGIRREGKIGMQFLYHYDL